MDKEKANKLLELYGRPVITIKDTEKKLIFARQSSKDIIEIEKMSTNKLIKEWKGLVWTNHIYGQVDLNELQRIDLIELEMDSRKNINNDKLKLWFEDAEKKQQEQENME